MSRSDVITKLWPSSVETIMDLALIKKCRLVTWSPAFSRFKGDYVINSHYSLLIEYIRRWLDLSTVTTTASGAKIKFFID